MSNPTGQRFAIPQVSLREIVTLQSGAVDGIEMIGTVPVYRLRGELLPLVVLTDVLQMPQSAPSERQSAQILVLQAVGHRFGLIVDRVRNTEEIVVKPLHKLLNRLAVYSGATIMGDGRVALILDVVGVARGRMWWTRSKPNRLPTKSIRTSRRRMTRGTTRRMSICSAQSVATDMWRCRSAT